MLNGISKITQVLSKRKDLLAIYLFGSHAVGKQTKKSDIDIALLLKGKIDSKKTFDVQLGVRSLLEDELGREDIDVVVINTADPFLRFQVYSKGKLLWTKDKSKTEELKWRYLREYWDYIPIKRMLDDSAIDRLRQFQ